MQRSPTIFSNDDVYMLSFVFLESWFAAQFSIISKSYDSSYLTLFLMAYMILLILLMIFLTIMSYFWTMVFMKLFLDHYSEISGGRKRAR